MCLATSGNPIGTLVDTVGTPEQKELFMPRLVKESAGLGFTEPCAGSDSAGIQTTAVKDGDEWVLNGQKTLISFADVFEWFLISAKTNETAPGGISAFLVHKDTPGFKVGSIFKKIGVHGSQTGEIFLEDCRVPAINMIGQENHGLRGVLAALDESRIVISANALGVAEAAFEVAKNYAKQRTAFGQPIAKFQGISWYLAEMDAKLAAANALLNEAADAFDKGQNITVPAARAKLIAGETVMFVTDRAVQICGGIGYIEDFGVGRMWRDARLIPIGEGSDEVLKTVIARGVLR